MSNNQVDVILGKALSWLLRHGAIKEKLNISPEGYIAVDEILNHKSFRGKYTFADVDRVVRTNNKKRFELRNNGEIWEIKANQGHSLHVENLELLPLLEASAFPQCIHGTYYQFLNIIKTQGLSRMNRNHIHFANDLPINKTVVSGARASAQVFIYINISAALAAGILFYKSSNGVILSPGDENGFIEPKYFQKICNIDGNLIK